MFGSARDSQDIDGLSLAIAMPARYPVKFPSLHEPTTHASNLRHRDPQTVAFPCWYPGTLVWILKIAVSVNSVYKLTGTAIFFPSPLSSSPLLALSDYPLLLRCASVSVS